MSFSGAGVCAETGMARAIQEAAARQAAARMVRDVERDP